MSLYIDNVIDKNSILENSRQLLTLPSHFVTMKLSINTSAARDWIWKNLTGRFFISYEIFGFEDPAEASMFALVADQFKPNDNF